MPSKITKVALVAIIVFVFLVWIAYPMLMAITENNLPHEMHAQLTGEDAVSDTTTFDVHGTDLGIITMHNGRYYYIFGDTFGAETSFGNNWRSNTIAISDDTDPSDGITLNEWIITPGTSCAKELISSLKVDNVEMTCIPTAAMSIGGTIYIYYMSVRHWSSTGGVWTCNNASIAVSTDDGHTFTKMNNISWPGDSNFVQFGVAQEEELTSSHLYLLTTPSGRFGACYLCRVDTSEMLNQSAYEYYMDSNTLGDPIWASDYDLATAVFPAPVGEVSVMWNPYVQQWTAFYTDNAAFSIVMRTAEDLWGPWSMPDTIVDASEYPSLYGSYVHPELVEDNGRVVYFIMSVFSVYNTFVMSVDLTSKGA